MRWWWLLSLLMLPLVHAQTAHAQTERVATTQTSIGLFYQPGAPERVNLRVAGVTGDVI